MGFRTLYISNEYKLSLKLDNIIIASYENKLSIPLADISAVIIENNNIILTVPLINAFVENNINIIICNKQHMPQSQIIPLNSNFHQTKNLIQQINWSKERNELLWTEIIKHKIHNQQQCCTMYNISNANTNEFTILLNEMQLNDISNREGVAAKYYFATLFDKTFKRSDETIVNAYLNYGYAILLASVARSIVSKGLILPLGIHHKNEYNHYNLACDFMEPYRPILDYFLIALIKDNFNNELTAVEKSKICNVMNEKILQNNKQINILNSIDIYINSILKYINNETDTIDIIQFPYLIANV